MSSGKKSSIWRGLVAVPGSSRSVEPLLFEPSEQTIPNWLAQADANEEAKRLAGPSCPETMRWFLAVLSLPTS
jgi:hypothetical protein